MARPKHTIASFKKAAAEKFKGKYDYSKVDRIDSITKVTIICPTHGETEQNPSLHLKSKFGCEYCAGRKKTTESFIEDANEKYGDIYDYSLAVYQGRLEEVEIVCAKHDPPHHFHLTPNQHIYKGMGCDLCQKEKKDAEFREKGLREFLKKAKKKYGEKYDYSKVNYINNYTKVQIFCPLDGHGYFEKSPSNHIKNKSPQGCPKCTQKKKPFNKKTTAIFIKEAKQKHQSDQFDYSKVKYKSKDQKVTIICTRHSPPFEFSQEANSHLRGTGCPKCSGKLKRTTESFIKEARERWGDQFDYSKVEYKTIHEKVIIGCKKEGHGFFEQVANSHLVGMVGCTWCNKMRKFSLDDFLERASKKYGDQYDYSKVSFRDSREKITVVCRDHGSFETTPAGHLRRRCPECIGPARKRVTIEEFKRRANEYFDGFYDYSEVILKNLNTNVLIKCPYHGSFSQRPSHHLNGAGCPTCRESRGEFLIGKTLRKLNLEYHQQTKFPECRNKQELPFDFALIHSGKFGLIEFQGDQHFRVVSFGKGKKSDLKGIKKRDQIKKDFCKKFGIPLLILTSQDIDSLETKIQKFVSDVESASPSMTKIPS